MNTTVMQKEQKKKPSKSKIKINALREEVQRLRSELMRLEGERIEMAVRQTDLMSQWNSVSATYQSAVRERDKTILELLLETDGTHHGGNNNNRPSEKTLNNEELLRAVGLPAVDKEVQTELW
ncbi:uncharacterized protein LOC128734858 [Sabethes cyaneus]|uniref:uncharacterized protein LOC128734858 n=1 Tax=Sabethes cyaneus TaxID=53552 RepID=UPI00237D43FE|nr:uncharacterized protein LOC128734858 [Sabethes cyaneus]